MRGMKLPEDTDAELRAAALRYSECDGDLRDWAEAQGVKNLESRIASGAALSARAQGLMNFLLAGLGGAGLWAGQLLAPAAPLTAWGAAVAMAWLAVLTMYLAWQVLRVHDAPSVYTRPEYLAVPGLRLDQVKPGELARLDERIRQQAALNNWLAGRLNWVYRLAAAVPLVFAAATVAAWRLLA
jgi:hypothetical protein